MTTHAEATRSFGPSGDIADTDIRQFKLNHPKNYIAVPIATAAAGETDALIREFAVGLPTAARKGAVEAGLVTDTGEITRVGEACLVTARRVHGSLRDALAAIETLHGSPKRFVDAFPGWQSIVRRIAFQYGPTQEIIAFLRTHGPLRLHELTWLLWKRDPALATEIFLHPSIRARGTEPTYDRVASPDSYRSEAVFQFKAFLYHCGILDRRGADTSRLCPAGDVWRLDEAYGVA